MDVNLLPNGLFKILPLKIDENNFSTKYEMDYLGGYSISAFYHDSAAALVVDGDLVAACQKNASLELSMIRFPKMQSNSPKDF